MAITTSIAKGYAWRNVLIGAVCAVLGVWGIYDYFVKIPAQQRGTERIEVLRLCKAALETTQATDEPNVEALAALAAIDLQRAALGPELQRQINETVRQGGGDEAPEELRARMSEYIRESGDIRWYLVLALVERGLRSRRSDAIGNDPEASVAYQMVNDALAGIGQVRKPAKFDRAMQWLFIGSLLIVPWSVWTLVATSRRRYTLDDDGTLHMPEGTWARDEIADIDMSRWMAKSVAWVVHSDGARVKLDDYKHQDLHRIVGALACRLHPEEWDDDARPRSERAREAVAASDGETGDSARKPPEV